MSQLPRAATAALLTALVAVPAHAAAQDAARAPEALEAELAELVRPETLLALARLRNPDVAEARARAAAAEERAGAAGRLPPPEFQAQLVEAPAERALAVDEARMWMFGLRQAIPSGLGARRASARAATGSAREAARASEADLARDVHAAFWDYARAHRTHAAREESIAIGARIERLARSVYESGKSSQQDILRIGLDVARARSDLAGDAAAVETARARLNALLARDAGAPLGPPAELDARGHAVPAVETLQAGLGEARPELAGAARAVEQARAEAAAARRDAIVPSLMLGVDYGYMPMEEMHTYSAMVGVSLPWVWGGRRAEARAAQRTADAEARALESVRQATTFELRDAHARVRAAQRSMELLDAEIVPQAKQNLDAAQAAFAGGRGDALSLLDALRSLTAVRIERAQATARLEIALADLARAAGRDLSTLSQDGAVR